MLTLTPLGGHFMRYLLIIIFSVGQLYAGGELKELLTDSLVEFGEKTNNPGCFFGFKSVKQLAENQVEGTLGKVQCPGVEEKYKLSEKRVHIYRFALNAPSSNTGVIYNRGNPIGEFSIIKERKARLLIDNFCQKGHWSKDNATYLGFTSRYDNRCTLRHVSRMEWHDNGTFYYDDIFIINHKNSSDLEVPVTSVEALPLFWGEIEITEGEDDYYEGYNRFSRDAYDRGRCYTVEELLVKYDLSVDDLLSFPIENGWLMIPKERVFNDNPRFYYTLNKNKEVVQVFTHYRRNDAMGKTLSYTHNAEGPYRMTCSSLFRDYE